MTKSSPKVRTLAWITAGCFILYLVLAAIQFAPHLSSLSGAEQFSIAKHLVVVAAISAFVVVSPKYGSLVALAWGAIVPFERYVALGAELVAGTLGMSETFAGLDVVRLILLLAGTAMSGVLAYVAFRAPGLGLVSPDRNGA